MALRVLQLQDSLAIEEVVAGENLIEASKVLAQDFHLRLVKLGEKRRNRIRRQHRS